MDDGIGRWARRGIGFALGILIVVAVVAGLVETSRLVALVFMAILYLVSPAGAYVTGKIIEVDGGLQSPNLEFPLPDL